LKGSLPTSTRWILFGTLLFAVLVLASLPLTATAERFRVVTTRVEIRLADDAESGLPVPEIAVPEG
jgi:hypothetical protein